MIAGVINQPPEEGRSGWGIRTPLIGAVEFSDVTFRYHGSTTPALDRVSFSIPEGSVFGIVGRSGSGKTTVTRLLQLLHSDYQGLIKIDGNDLREIDVDHLRSSLGVVLQENFLFRGSIRETIAASKPDASFEEIVQAARLAGAEEFIEQLPRGYETFIQEGSTNLSGGQRQRLAIARADRRSADPDPRRGNQRARCRQRGHRQHQPAAHRAGPDADRHFAPPLLADRLRLDPRARTRPRLPHRHPSGAARPLRHLQRAVAPAASAPHHQAYLA